MNEFENISSAVLPYNQAEIEAVMKQIMYAQGITDVMYEGSNISQLTSVVSYVIASLNANTAMNLQETLLPLATKRMNILFGARQLGYEPHAIKSYKYELLLKPKYDETKTIIDPNTGEEIIDTNNKDDRTISLVKNTRFKSGDKYYYYVGPTLANVITVSNFDIQYINDETQGRPASEITLKIPVVEGIMTTPQEDEMLRMIAVDYIDEKGNTKTKQDYLIGYSNVEEDYGLQVYLTYIDENGYPIYNEEWTKSEQFLIDESFDYNKRKFIRKENIILGYPTIFFQFAGLGQGIRTGTEISVNVLQSSGDQGEALEDFEIDDVVFSTEMEVSEYQLIEEGRSEETDDEIKDNAIVFKNTANRAVTRYDYITISKRHDLVGECDAWGGEEEYPQEKGNIWISCTPSKQTRPVIEFGNGYNIDIGTPSHEIESQVQKNWKNWYLDDKDYETVIGYLDAYKIMTMDINYRHPLYINFDYAIDIVKYDISQDPKTINALVFSTINEYFIKNLEKFDTEYLNSNIQRVLDTVLGYNTGVNFEVRVTGTLCEDMIDKFKKDNYNKNEIHVSLSWPFENIWNNETGDIDSSMLPSIDGNFGIAENGFIYVDLTELEGQEKFRRSVDIMYRNENDINLDDDEMQDGRKMGEYIIDLEKYTIELVFSFDNEVTLDEIFGEVNEEGYRQYTEFEISYYPFDQNLVNLSFSRNRIPRLRSVYFKN
jgi:hypothetical protein